MDIELTGGNGYSKINRYVLSGDLIAGRVSTIKEGSTAQIETNYYHLDHLNSTKVVTGENGEIVVSYEYRAFGDQLKRLDEQKQETEDLGKYSYGGKELDDENGLYYFNARYYDSTTGRFINVDPIQDGTNWYIYCNNNPLNMVDPTGLGAFAVALTAFTTDVSIPEPTDAAWQKWVGWGCVLGTAYLIDKVVDIVQSNTNAEAPTAEVPKAGDKEEDVIVPGEGEGSIYKVPGDYTPTDKDYIGSTNDLEQRIKNGNDGRDREHAEVIDTYPIGDRAERRRKEQQAINDNGGVSNLDNKINEIAEKKWDKLELLELVNNDFI